MSPQCPQGLWSLVLSWLLPPPSCSQTPGLWSCVPQLLRCGAFPGHTMPGGGNTWSGACLENVTPTARLPRRAGALPKLVLFWKRGIARAAALALGVGRTALGASEPATRDCQSRLVSLNSGYTLTSQFFLPSPRPPFPSMKSWAPRLRKAHRFIAY